MYHIKKIIYWLVLISLIAPSYSALASDKPFTFSVVPQQSPSKTVKLWGPLISLLEKSTGQSFEIKIYKNIPDFENALAQGIDDFSYMNPYHYTVFHDMHGYIPLVHAADRLIKGIVVVKKDSPYQTIEDLKNKTLAFPAPAAFAATLLPRGTFKIKGIEIHSEFVGSHDSVYLRVSRGLVPVGGGIIRTLQNMPQRVQNNLRVLWTSKGFTPHCIAVHPRVPGNVAEEVRKALIDLAGTENGKKILERLNVKGWVNARDSDWDDVRSLHLSTLD